MSGIDNFGGSAVGSRCAYSKYTQKESAEVYYPIL